MSTDSPIWITDEIVEAGARGMWDEVQPPLPPWDEVDEPVQRRWLSDSRQVLTAALPHIMAETAAQLASWSTRSGWLQQQHVVAWLQGEDVR